MLENIVDLPETLEKLSNLDLDSSPWKAKSRRRQIKSQIIFLFSLDIVNLMCSRTKPPGAVGILDSEARSQPLQSVENQINQNVTGGLKTEKITKKTAKMNSNFAMPSLKIKSEPFADFYTVEKEIGRYVLIYDVFPNSGEKIDLLFHNFGTFCNWHHKTMGLNFRSYCHIYSRTVVISNVWKYITCLFWNYVQLNLAKIAGELWRT